MSCAYVFRLALGSSASSFCSAPFLFPMLDGEAIRRILGDSGGHSPGQRTYGVEVGVSIEWDNHMQPSRSSRHQVWNQIDRFQHVAHCTSSSHNGLKRPPRRVQVEN